MYPAQIVGAFLVILLTATSLYGMLMLLYKKMEEGKLLNVTLFSMQLLQFGFVLALTLYTSYGGTPLPVRTLIALGAIFFFTNAMSCGTIVSHLKNISDLNGSQYFGAFACLVNAAIWSIPIFVFVLSK